MKELEKNYNPSEIEDKLYDNGLRRSIFMLSQTRTRNHLPS